MNPTLHKCLCFLLLFALLGTPGYAADPQPSSDVVVGAHTLFTLPSGIGSITAEERARIVNRRIERILHDPKLDPRTITVQLLRDGTPVIMLGEVRIVEVMPRDAATYGLPAEEVAEQWASSLRTRLTQLQPLFAQQQRTVGVKTLNEHRVLLLILQVAVLLLAARVCGELALRLGQPPVIGQLLAGILLGHSVLGALWPELKALVFPVEATQSYLLEVVSWIGVLFLLLLTGLETDVALIRQQGRPVVFIALTGIVFPFGLGAVLGYFLPASLLTAPESRLVLALFLGTVLSVSSVPVIAKILLDMQLLRRNVGQLILASALVHDTIGWIILGVIASLATSGKVEFGLVARTIGGTLVFMLAAATVGRWGVRRLLRLVNDRLRMEQAVLTAVVVLTMLSAAVTQLIGVHAVLGAFVIGILLRESPVVNERVLHPLEAVTTAIFAPIFFAAAGLHVNLGLLASPPLIVMGLLLTGAACLGKIGGCYFGARWAGSPHWDSLSVGFGTNARGAMGLIVGILGFSLGILTVDMFSLIVVMAVLTTAMTPPLLRWSLERVKPVGEEEARLRQEALREGSFISRLQRVLVPTRGGGDAQLGLTLIDALGTQHPVEVTGLYVQTSEGDPGGDEAHRSARARLAASGASYHPLTLSPRPPEEAIMAEQARGYDLLAVGAGPSESGPESVFSSMVDSLARDVRLPLLVVRSGEGRLPFRRILLPTSTASYSVQAAELAVAIARASGAQIVVLHVYEKLDEAVFWLRDYDRRAEEAGRDLAEQVQGLAEAYEVPVETVFVRADQAGPEIVRVAREEAVDLILMGGSARPTRNLFLGPTISTVLRGVECSVAILRP